MSDDKDDVYKPRTFDVGGSLALIVTVVGVTVMCVVIFGFQVWANINYLFPSPPHATETAVSKACDAFSSHTVDQSRSTLISLAMQWSQQKQLGITKIKDITPLRAENCHTDTCLSVESTHQLDDGTTVNKWEVWFTYDPTNLSWTVAGSQYGC